MTVRQQWLFVGGIVGVLAVALSAGMWLMRDQLFPVEVGSRAPDFVAREVNGANGVKTLADYKDKVVVLNIWGHVVRAVRGGDADIRAAQGAGA